MTTNRNPVQPDLFAAVAAAYADSPDGKLDNASLYRLVAQQVGLDEQTLNHRSPVGAAGAMRSLVKRKIRWHQQALKQIGVISPTGARGIWQLTEPITKQLDKVIDNTAIVAFSTELGVAILGDCKKVFAGDFAEPIHLVITSPPYPLKNARDYGNPAESKYVDFICESVEPLLRNMAPGASLVLNVSPNIFKNKSPARSTYIERLTLALEDLGLELIDRVVWRDPNKLPGPTFWACVNRVQLCAEYEFVLWFSNDALKMLEEKRSDNRRVLIPHSEQHIQLMQSGGEQRTTNYGDGAYKLRHGSFAGETSGKIPKNVLSLSHNCKDTRAFRKAAKLLGFPAHGAMFPSSVPEFFIKLLTKENELVVDPFGGSGKTGLVAERLRRRWIISEIVAQYARTSAELFRGFANFNLNPAWTI